MKKITLIILLLSTLFCASSYALLLSGEGVVFNQSTGDYLFSYREGGGANDPLVQIPFIPATKIEPKLTSYLKQVEGGQIRYRYSLFNGAKAKQSIVDLRLFGLPASTSMVGTSSITEGANQLDSFESALTVPNANWYGMGARAPKKALNISWNYDYDDERTDLLIGIRPGTLLTGFGLLSQDLPGLILAQIQGGGTGHLGFPGFAPDGEVLELGERLHENDFIPGVAAAPMIAVPSPYSAAILIDRIRSHFNSWTAMPTTGYNGNVPPAAKINLLDATFASQLDRYLVAAAEAFRHNQSKVGRGHLETVRELLKKEHPDLERNDEASDDHDERKNTTRFTIDRLAARVLDFDVKYVLERSEYNEGHR
ncbi:MAG: hypothetical protein PXX73_00110 [Sideroxydans sp.]|nr:hypothetical protein [Sideroxydans sp.]